MFLYFSVDYERDLDDFKSKSFQEVAEAEFPLMFISCPSGKDTSWEERYPGLFAEVLNL